ncbi:Biotin/lipoyl attachment domain-containing protein isoform 1 [Hibiscus syriacus]|uniref:Biotin/lipoyl attachment domain-containing protein isoform 1 n=1 Tax=Hibiscus syriacus TaxID=106335 RepID=A0A6A3B0D8_HIBSY|nr:protein ANTAGONIST OF LIKE HETEROCHROMATIN PROTEIN 1-like [Hibiscus syriacus]KAE8710430.1 Biotin/lipoyl attachment domain-containing protein isoform 1 [Hibiscus syriacus]
METQSFTFLSPQPLSHYNALDFSWFSDMEMGFNGNSKKLSRRDTDESLVNGEDLKNDGFKDILSSLLLLDEGAPKQEQHQWLTGFEPTFEADYKEKVEEIDATYHCSKMEDSSSSRKNKRSRKSGSVAASSSTVSVGSDNAGLPESSGGSGHQRRLWVKSRSKDWWERCNHPDFSDEEFKRVFRMSKSTFDLICEELETAVMKKNTMLREAIPVRQRVAVCIWRLATGEPLRMVSKRFGLGISTCHKLILEVCSAIKTVLMPKYLQWPDENKMKQIKDEFESITGIPNVGGSMYTTHIPIIAPKTSVASYFNKKHTERNQKTSYSITLQGVVDQNGVFTDACIGWPGSMTDDQVLEKSAFHQRATMGQLKDVWVVGGKGYPLMDWVLVPYTHQNLTWGQHAFNEKIWEIEKVGKEAFARLKGRWGCLQKRIEVKLQELPVVLGACCVLHNICELRNEEIEPGLKFEVFDDEVIPENNLRSMASDQARDRIAHNLLHHGLGGATGFY